MWHNMACSYTETSILGLMKSFFFVFLLLRSETKTENWCQVDLLPCSIGSQMNPAVGKGLVDEQNDFIIHINTHVICRLCLVHDLVELGQMNF